MDINTFLYLACIAANDYGLIERKLGNVFLIAYYRGGRTDKAIDKAARKLKVIAFLLLGRYITIRYKVYENEEFLKKYVHDYPHK